MFCYLAARTEMLDAVNTYAAKQIVASGQKLIDIYLNVFKMSNVFLVRNKVVSTLAA